MTQLKGSIEFIQVRDQKKLTLSGHKGGAFVMGVANGAESKLSYSSALRKNPFFDSLLSEVSEGTSFKATHESTLWFLKNEVLSKELSHPMHLLALGLGKTSECYAQKNLSLGARIAKTLRDAKVQKSVLLLESIFNPAQYSVAADAPKDFAGRSLVAGIPTLEEFFEQIVTGFYLGLYSFDRYKSKDPKEKKTDEKIELQIASIKLDSKKAKTVLEKAKAISEAVYLTRDLQNIPGADLTPAMLAKAAQQAGKESAFSVTVWDEKKLATEGCGGILAVGQGAINPPRMVIMEHNRGSKNLPTVVLVGKGITFDSGGYSLKPGNAMEMKMDMSGAAAVIGAMKALAELKAPVHVVGIVPTAENMIGSKAQRVGDIYKAFDGQTVEVLNTDAEGRLILGDALAFAKTFNPTCVLDCATLTGAVTIALGSLTSGLLGNNAALIDGFKHASEHIGERVWELPLYPEYADDMKSKIADVKNIGSNREAGTCKGASFLNFFVKDAYPWIHLDVAATADTPSGQGTHCPADSGTGVPMRAFVEFTLNMKKYFSNGKAKRK